MFEKPEIESIPKGDKKIGKSIIQVNFVYLLCAKVVHVAERASE